MATATPKMIQKTRMIPEVYTEKSGVTLELTNDEACFLSALLGFKLGGRLVDSPDVCLEIYRVLKAAGFATYGSTEELEGITKKYLTGMSGFVRLG